MAQQDPKIQSVQYQNVTFTPKLRKNRKIDLRWGNKYYDSVKTAVFTTQNTPHMPAEPPQSIREEIDKTGYVCKQCKDWFLSSIEEHTSRRSWVLGFWCQQCFVTTCTHKAQGKSNCSNCIDIETAKHDYLLSKGIKKNLKKAVTRVFYNQCQFFAHLRMHGINIVDLSDLMLMPLPSGIEPQHYAQLDKTWKAVMEIMFIRRIHIMDWVRHKKISWSEVLSSNLRKSDPVTDIVSRYSEDCIGTIDKSESSRQDNPIQFEDSRRIARSTGTQGNSNQPRLAGGEMRRHTLHVVPSKMQPVEEKFAPNDIAFVDCGPTPNHCSPESGGTSSPDRSTEFSGRGSSASSKGPPDVLAAKEPHIRQNLLGRPVSQQHDKLGVKHRDGTLKLTQDRTKSLSLPSIDRTGPRVLTIRSPRSLSLSTIMKHLPSDELNRKNIVIVAEDSEAKNGLLRSPESVAAKRDRLATSTPGTPSLVPITSKTNAKSKAFTATKILPPSNLLISHKDKPGTAPNAVSQSFSEQMSLHGKILHQNGRKYIIRHVPKAKYDSIVQDSIAAKTAKSPVQNPAQNPARLSLPATKRLLLPKPEPVSINLPTATTVPVTITVPVQKSIIINRQVKPAKILPKVSTAPTSFSLVPVKKMVPIQSNKSRISKLQKSLIIKIRESMQNELQETSKKDLDAYIENLKEINAAYTKIMGFDNDSVISNNLKVIEHFEQLAIAALSTNTVKEEPDAQLEDVFEKAAKDWELNMKDLETGNCETCDKRVKPTSYIVGISGPASDETIYCQCCNNICYLCNANQGSLMQLKTHINWHKGKKPFMCPDCSISFKTNEELEVHVWTTCFHSMARHIYGCSVCEIEGILDMESVAKHFLLIHTRRKTICSHCKMEYTEHAPSPEEYAQHFAKSHPEVTNITGPKRLYLCNLKQCVVRPEQFRAHLSDHIGVVRSIYYKCPFCSMITQGTGRNKTMIREHLIAQHLDRLHEVVSVQSLAKILKGIKSLATGSTAAPQTIAGSTGKVLQVSTAGTSGPMIINARTITPETFEHGAESSRKGHGGSTIPKILEVRSEATEELGKKDSMENGFTMQIIAVESMVENTPESPAPKSETSEAVSQESTSDELASLSEDNGATVGLQIYASPTKANVGDDSSNSHEDMTVVLKRSMYEDATIALDNTCTPPKLERKPSSLLGTTEDSQEWNISEKSESEPVSTSDTEKNSRRPWRIALNSPTSMETPAVAYNCHLCGELINTSWSVVKSHFSSRHASEYELSTVSTQIPQISPGYIEGGYRDDCGVRKRKPAEGPVTPGPKRRRRWGPKKYFEKPGSPSLGLCVRPEPVQDVEGRFRCKKCDEHFDEIAMMREHIATKHRIKGQYLICLECGENFVVVPSLQMHLKALHGIQDPITYLTQNTAYAPDTPEDADEEERTTESNQCYVCMAVFEDKAAVDKHIRVHGMAFLKRKRFEAQKAQKCWEKKSETSDSSSNAVSLDNKSKNAEEASKLSSNNVETPSSNSNAGSSDDQAKSMQKPLKFWVKKFDFPDSNASVSSDDKSRNVENSSLTTQDNAIGPLGAKEAPSK